jgi:hypothetical protein
MTTVRKGISPQSRKAKGRKLQQLVRDYVLAAFPALSKDDVWSRSMGAGGTDVQLSQAAKSLFPYSVECKSGKLGGTVPKKVYDWIGQAQEHLEPGEEEHPLVVFKADYKQPYVIVSLEHFMELTKRGH